MTAADPSRWTLVAGPHYRPPDIDTVDGVATRTQGLSLLRTTYYDTPDLRLLRSGAELRRETGRGWTAVLGSGDSAAQHVAPVHQFADSHATPAAAIDLLTGFTRGAPLRPVLHTRTERREVLLQAAGGEDAGSLRDDLVTVMQGRRIATRFRELEIIAAGDGAGASLGAVVAALRDAGAAPATSAPTATRAMGAAAAAAPDISVPATSRQPSAAEAIRRAIALSVSRLVLHDAAVRLGVDPEGVHQARVATRRLRSDLRTFRPLLDPPWVQRLRDELHAIADLLGEVRDTDVLLARLGDAVASLPAEEMAAAPPVLPALEVAREAARVRLLEYMRGDRYLRLLDDLVDAAANPRTAPEASGHAAALLPPLARGPWRRLRRRVDALAEEPPDAELHEVRILAKRARYAAEAVAAVSRPAVAEFASAVAALQEVLGDHHDAVVAEQWLRERGDAAENAFVLGELVGLERAAAAECRRSWRRIWTAARRAHPSQWS